METLGLLLSTRPLNSIISTAFLRENYIWPVQAEQITTLDEAEALTEATDGIGTRETVRGMQFATRTTCVTKIEIETEKEEIEIGVIRAPGLHAPATLITTVHAVVAQGDIRGHQRVIEERTERTAREDVHGLVLGL